MTANRSLRARPFVLAWLTILVAGSAGAAEEGRTLEAGATGKYVYRDGSKSKQLEDHNVQSGVDAFLRFEDRQDDGTFRLEGFGQSGERQGWVTGQYEQLGLFDLVLDFDYWTEYYNRRDGDSRPSLFPFTNDSEVFFGDGVPSTDWLTTGAAFDVQVGPVIHDVYGGFHYRDVDGDQTLLKGGGVDGVADASGTIFPIPANADTGPINFGFPSRKDVDYDAYMAEAGMRSGLLGIHWQTDVGFQYHDIDSSVFEVSFATPAPGNGTLAAVDRFRENTDLRVWKADIAGSRHVSQNLFLFGAGFFSYERSDPEPSTSVFENVTGLTLETRRTSTSKVDRYTPGGSLGMVWRPLTRLVVRADARARGHFQDADLTEVRDETALLTLTAGDFSVVTHSADRDAFVGMGNVSADWKPIARLTVRADARYQYRWDDIDSRQDTTLLGDRPEVEDYDQELHRFTVGPTIRYRLRRGRSVEGGYEFLYTDVDQDVDELRNQYNLGDYEQFRHRVFGKASGRLMDKLRGELRAHYVYETREMDGAVALDALGNPFVPASSAKVRMWSWLAAPVVYWLPHQKWTLHGRYSVGQTQIESDSGGNVFEYEVLTQSLNAGVSFRPTDTLSLSGDYTFYVNDDDVDNNGHNAAVRGDLQITDALSVNGGLRYLGYNADSSPDDYDAVVISVGIRGEF